jgi:hypothetical protein
MEADLKLIMSLADVMEADDYNGDDLTIKAIFVFII